MKSAALRASVTFEGSDATAHISFGDTRPFVDITSAGASSPKAMLS